MLKLYNALTRNVTEFKPLEEGLVKMYSCGPTVYSYPHIGNMRAYIFMDSLRRILKYNGYTINGVMNITDVGHLTSDEDSGDDKMELSAKKENKSPYEIAEFYTNVFLSDLSKLNIDKPEHITKATDYVEKMINFIKILEEKGHTYTIDGDGVYFDIQSFPSYGVLSGKKLDEKGVSRTGEKELKKHPFDFALWKQVPTEHIMKWNSPWGVGCPGWHTECCVMSKDILGDKFDIHTGGVDHKPIHHENEIAQNNSAMGHNVVQRWMHNEFVQIDGGKMSKSLGNIYTITDLEDMGFNPMSFKYFCLQTYYGKKINFTMDNLKASQIALTKLHKLLNEHKSSNAKTNQDVIDKYDTEFLNAINDDLNTPLAIGIIWTMLKLEPKSNDLYNLVLKFDKALGLKLDEAFVIKKENSIPQEVQAIAEERWIAKKAKNWAKADELRNKLINMGYTIKDSKDGYEICLI